MAQVAKKDQFVEDVHGIRRLIKAGDQIPGGMFDVGAVDVEEVHVRTLARPVVDEEASKSHHDRFGSGAGRDPLEGVSFDRAKELQGKQREGKDSAAPTGTPERKASQQARKSQD